MSSAAAFWKINWPVTAFAVLLLPCLLGLGVWQLQRAEQKRALLDEFEQRRHETPLTVNQLPQAPELYTRVALRGSYDNARSFLLDNRIANGRFGYEIITPFLPEAGGHAVLVNRGWIAGDPARRQQPVIGAVEGPVSLTGTVYREGAHVQLVENLVPGAAGQWPVLIQNLRIDDLQAQLGSPVYPFIVRIDPDMPGAYRAHWPMAAPGFGPERHIAYAVTWFAMAFTLVAAWLLVNSNLGLLFRGNRN